MKVAEFREILEALERVYVCGGARSQGADLKAMIEALRPSDDIEFETYLDALRGHLGCSKSVTEHVAALKVASLDEGKFGAAFSVLSSDKSLRNNDIDDIGAAYTEFAAFGRMYKSRAEKLDQIKRAFYERLGFEKRGRVVDRVAPWQ